MAQGPAHFQKEAADAEWHVCLAYYESADGIDDDLANYANISWQFKTNASRLVLQASLLLQRQS